MKDNIIAKALEQSQSIKEQPIFINITTEGIVNDGYLDRELNYGRKVIQGEIEDNSILVWLYTQDCEQEVWQSPETWVKSNPSLGTLKQVSYLEKQLNKSKVSKADRIAVLTKDFNIKQNNSESWLLEHEYTCEGAFDIGDFRGYRFIGGVDLAETTDLCAAKALFMKKGERTKYILSRYFIPERKVIDSGDIIDYKEMARLGLVDVSPGNEVLLERVAEWFYSLYTNYNIVPFKIGYDNRFAKTWLSKMEDYGWFSGLKESDTCERVDQNKMSLSNPMKLLESDIKSGYLNNNQNPVDRWCYQNTSVKVDDLGYCMPIKAAGLARNRIDGAVADIIAYAILMRYRTEFSELGIRK